MKKISLLFSLCTLGWLIPAQAALPPLDVKPNLTTKIERTPVKPTAFEALVDLVIGQGIITTATQQSFLTNTTQTTLKAGELLTLPKNARGRLKFSNGSFLLLGEETQLKFNIQKDKISLQLYSGKIIAYNVTGFGKNIVLEILVKEGKMTMQAGKVGIELDTNQQVKEIAMFSENGFWTDNTNKTLPLPTNAVLRQSASNQFQVSFLNDTQENQWIQNISPEPNLVIEAIKRFSQGQLKEAYSLFSAIQQAFPYNPLAMYYLGLISLEEKRYGETIRQWQNYSKIDPAGAQEKDIPSRLTLLLNQQLQDEIKLALATEAKLGDVKPEPNSVAVQAMTLRGDAKYQIISKGLTAMIITDLTKIPGLKVLERQKLQKLLDEIKLSQSGLVDEKTLIRSGKLMRAEKFVFGDFEIKAQQITPTSPTPKAP